MEGNRRSHGKSFEGKRDSFSSRLFGIVRSAKDEVVSLASTPSPDLKHGIDNEGAYRNNLDMKLDHLTESGKWMPVAPGGKCPEPRQNHAATVIGRRMIVVGGEYENGKLNDVQVLHLGKLQWSEVGKGSSEEQGGTHQLPLCRGHSLVSWGKTLLLVGGETDPHSERVAVWSFDTETERWTEIQCKGEVPGARTGQSVTRAGSILILFGGEDMKGKKLNDVHVLDLKSLMWLPLHTLGKGPSPRGRHVAAMYNDRFLLVFGGASKSKLLNDTYALDFETMEWSKLKPKGPSPSPRAGCGAVLVGDKWYIAGGEHRSPRFSETLVLDIKKIAWSSIQSAIPNKGLSVVTVQRNEKLFLVAFGGFAGRHSNQVQVFHIPVDGSTVEEGSLKEFSPDDVSMTPVVPNSVQLCLNSGVATRLACANIDIAKRSQTHLTDHAIDHVSGIPGLVPLRKMYAQPQNASTLVTHKEIVINENATSPLDACNKDLDGTDMFQSSISCIRNPTMVSNQDIVAGVQSVTLDAYNINGSMSGTTERSSDLQLSNEQGTNPEIKDLNIEVVAEPGSQVNSQIDTSIMDATTELGQVDGAAEEVLKLKQHYESMLAAAIEKNKLYEEKIADALKSKEESENTLSVTLKSWKKDGAKLALVLREREELKEKVAAAELAQEESNNLSNIVHSENVRLEHDLAFVKAVLEETQKELHSTRAVLAGERSRAFQLQVELFELKQKLQANGSKALV